MKRGKRLLAILLVLILSVSMAGCSKFAQQNQSASDTTSSKRITHEDVKKKVINEASEYLKKNYPDDNFTFVSIGSTNWAYNYYRLSFKSEKYDNQQVMVYGSLNDESEVTPYTYSDDYYQYYMKDDAEEYFSLKLKKYLENEFVIKVTFTTGIGGAKAVNNNQTFAENIENDNFLCWVYIFSNQEFENVDSQIEKFAKEMMGQITEEVAMQAETTDIPELPTEDIQGTTLPRDKQEKEMAETQIKSVPDSVVFQVVEEMPDFPGGMKALMDYLSKNVKYPAEAHAIGAQGRVIVSFTVKKDGSIADTKVERSVNPYLDKEAMRVIAAMPKWQPGKQRGEAVNVRFTVPVAFRLSDPELPKAEEIKQSDLDEVVVVGYGPQEDSTPGAVGVKGENADQAFTVVETMPKFPEGQAGLMRYLARSIKYPVIAQKNKEQGRVIIQMIIGTDGSLSNVKVLRSVSPSLDAEAIRVVGNMPKWEPGMQKGQAVPVKYTLPITFRLQ